MFTAVLIVACAVLEAAPENRSCTNVLCEPALNAAVLTKAVAAAVKLPVVAKAAAPAPTAVDPVAVLTVL